MLHNIFEDGALSVLRYVKSGKIMCLVFLAADVFV